MGIKWERQYYINCCNIVKPFNPTLAKFGLDYITHGADIFRSMKAPPIEQKPYEVKNPILKELASKHLLYLHKEKRFYGPFNPDQLEPGSYINAVFVKEKDLTREKILFLINYSAPKGCSINSEISKEFTTLVYPEFLFYIRTAAMVGP